MRAYFIQKLVDIDFVFEEGTIVQWSPSEKAGYVLVQFGENFVTLSATEFFQSAVTVPANCSVGHAIRTLLPFEGWINLADVYDTLYKMRCDNRLCAESRSSKL